MNTEMNPESGVDSIFMKGSQAVVWAITLEFKQQGLPESDLYDLFYFGCVFLGTLLNRLPRAERLQIATSVPAFINQASQDGITMCSKIITAQMGSPEDREKAMQQLIAALGASDTTDSETLLSISEDIEEMSMKESGLWKQKGVNHSNKDLETKIINRFEQIIEEVLVETRQMDNEKINTNPVLFFLVAVIVNVGLTAGYGSVLFKQSIEDFMNEGLEKLNEIIYFDQPVSSNIH